MPPPADAALPALVIPLFGGSAIAPAVRPALRVAVVGNYPPRKCGIATFTFDVVEQIGRNEPGLATSVYALDDAGHGREYRDVAAVIDRNSAEDYATAARAINAAAFDAVWLQHEFGIFGGADGEMVCDFVSALAAPVVITFHTVLSDPSLNQRRITEFLVSRASRIMVMSHSGRDNLVRIYRAPAEVIEIIPHGAPDRPFEGTGAAKARQGNAGRNVLMTFGLLSPGKGLERVIEALPAIVAAHPGTIYRIVGATHPNLVAMEGERYRESLMALAEKLRVADHVVWDNRFLEIDDLLDQLAGCDIYVTPYFNLQQATSGTLSYAVALGKAVVSTPYVHARELLADGVGVLVAPDSSAALADAINDLLDDPAKLAAMQRRAYREGRKTIWPRFAKASAALVRAAVAPRQRETPLTAVASLSGVFEMGDATGIFQHSIGIVPDRRHGYCLDDNARALILMNTVAHLDAPTRQRWTMIYASFVQHAWNPDVGRFRNFMRFDRTWCEDIGSEDSNGRCLWALGSTAAHAPDADMRRWGRGWFDETVPTMDAIHSPRAIAFAMLGAAAVLLADPSHARARALLERGGTVLGSLLNAARRPDWAWFEAVLGYDNPRMPQALIAAGQLLDRADWRETGLETLRWIAGRQTAVAGHFRPIGSETFGMDYNYKPFDQQPLEAQAAVEAAVLAFALTGDAFWQDHAMAAYRWFFGANDRGVVLADLASGRCRDGVTPRGANENCGAESILAFQLAQVAILQLLGQPLNRNPARPKLDDPAASEPHGLAHP